MVEDPLNSERAALTRRRAAALAWPIAVANAVVPLAGVVDTVVIGAVSDKSALGGVALGTTIFNVAYFTLYFLRMSTTGLTAQAHGARDELEVQRVLARASVLALGLSGLFLLVRGSLVTGGLLVLQGSGAVDDAAHAYFSARTLGAPGALLQLAFGGWLIGLGRTRSVLGMQAAFSAINVGLDLWFVLGLGWGVAGVGFATACADWGGATLGAILVWNGVGRRGGWSPGVWGPTTLLDGAALRRLLSMNGDLMVRSWALLLGISWFINSTARHGTAVLAGNHVLLQFITLWAFVLDAWAFTAEAEVGRAVGVGSLRDLRRAIRVTSELALLCGLFFAGVTYFAGSWVLAVVVADAEARAAAQTFLPYCALVPFIGAAAWQLDGIFIGATRSAALRNGALGALALYLAADALLAPRFGGHGTWIAFLGFYAARALTLAVAYPSLERTVARSPTATRVPRPITPR